MELAKKYYKEGSDYCDAESYDLALESYKKAEKALPDFPALHYNMGWLYSKLGDAQQAINHLQKIYCPVPERQRYHRGAELRCRPETGAGKAANPS